MALRIKSSQDFWTGSAFTAFGTGTVLLAQAIPLAVPRAWGPVISRRSRHNPSRSRPDHRAQITLKRERRRGGSYRCSLLVRVLFAVAAFAYMLHPLGLVLAAFIVVVVAAHAGHE